MTKEEIFAANLNRLMVRNNLSITEFAFKLHVSTSAVSRWINARQFPNINSFYRIMEFFKLSTPDALLTIPSQLPQQLHLPLPNTEQQKTTKVQFSTKAKAFILTHIKDIETIANDPVKLKQFNLFVQDGFISMSGSLNNVMQDLL